MTINTVMMFQAVNRPFHCQLGHLSNVIPVNFADCVCAAEAQPPDYLSCQHYHCKTHFRTSAGPTHLICQLPWLVPQCSKQGEHVSVSTPHTLLHLIWINSIFIASPIFIVALLCYFMCPVVTLIFSSIYFMLFSHQYLKSVSKKNQGKL